MACLLASAIGDIMSTTAPKSSSETAPSSGPAKLLTHPVDAMATAVDHVPGASAVKNVANGMLDRVGIVSPHARRVAAYAGVGLLGAVGVVEWPVAAAGAAVVWLTQPRPKEAEAAAAAAADQKTGRKSGQKSGQKARETKTTETRASGAEAKKAKATSEAPTARTTSGRSGPGRHA
jgi:hypothetical protein